MAESSSLSARDRKELECTATLVKSQEDTMKSLMQEVEDMGGFSLWWDKRGFFKTSNRDVLKGEIEKEKKIYSEYSQALTKVRRGDEDAEDAVLELIDALTELDEELAKNTNDSKLLERKYRDFVSVKGKLENKLNRMEAIVVRQQLNRTKRDFREAVNEIRHLRDDLQQTRNANDDLTARFERLMTVNEQLLNQQTELRQENVLIRTLLEDLIRRQDGGAGN